MAGRSIPIFIPFYLAVAWPLYLATRDSRDFIDRVAYSIPELTDNLPRALATIILAPWFNHSLDQLNYATVMLLVFGLYVERRLGWRRTGAVFFGTTAVAAVFAGLLLHVIYPEVVSGGEFEKAWNRTFSGGSAGAVGLNGVFASMMPRPFVVLGLFFAWEAGLWWFYLGSYTPVFHTTALVTGFLAGRYVLAANQRHQAATGT